MYSFSSWLAIKMINSRCAECGILKIISIEVVGQPQLVMKYYHCDSMHLFNKIMAFLFILSIPAAYVYGQMMDLFSQRKMYSIEPVIPICSLILPICFISIAAWFLWNGKKKEENQQGLP